MSSHDIPTGKTRVECVDPVAEKTRVVQDCDTLGEAILLANAHNKKRTSAKDPEYLVFNETYGLLHDGRAFHVARA